MSIRGNGIASWFTRTQTHTNTKVNSKHTIRECVSVWRCTTRSRLHARTYIFQRRPSLSLSPFRLPCLRVSERNTSDHFEKLQTKQLNFTCRFVYIRFDRSRLFRSGVRASVCVCVVTKISIWIIISPQKRKSFTQISEIDGSLIRSEFNCCVWDKQQPNLNEWRRVRSTQSDDEKKKLSIWLLRAVFV